MTAAPPQPPAGYPVPGGPYAPQAPRQNHKMLAAGVTVALVLATAALGVGIVLLLRPAPTPRTAPTPATAPTGIRGSTTDADRTLCTAIAPLMAETDRITKAWVGLGEAGTPARDAETPQFVTATQDWIRRIQPVLDHNPYADPFLKRSLQRFIDDQHLMVVDLVPGPLTSYAKALYNDGTGAYGGPLHLCDALGVKW